MNQDLIYQIAVGNLSGIGFQRIKAIKQTLGSFEEFFSLHPKDISSMFSIGTNSLDKWNFVQEIEKANQQIDFIQQNNLKATSFSDAEYSSRLRECFDAPHVLYSKGKTALNVKRNIAIVGTRNISSYGIELCNHLIEGLKNTDCTIVSGLAYGVDIKIHNLCLEHNIPTIGVLAHGLDRLYPALHAKTAAKMIEEGGLITEFPIGTNPDRENFPKRNRIVAGCVDAVIVVESGEKGGSLITCDLANGYNRDVFAFPGNVKMKYSRGCNQLIRDNKAILVTGADDVISFLGWNKQAKQEKIIQKSLFLELNEDEKKIFDLLKNEPLSMDQLSVKLNKSISLLTVELLDLELKGVVFSRPGNIYSLA